jgi:hypothetical protein
MRRFDNYKRKICFSIQKINILEQSKNPSKISGLIFRIKTPPLEQSPPLSVLHIELIKL